MYPVKLHHSVYGIRSRESNERGQQSQTDSVIVTGYVCIISLHCSPGRETREHPAAPCWSPGSSPCRAAAGSWDSCRLWP